MYTRSFTFRDYSRSDVQFEKGHKDTLPTEPPTIPMTKDACETHFICTLELILERDKTRLFNARVFFPQDHED